MLSPPHCPRKDLSIGQPSEHIEVVNEQQLREKIGRDRIPMPSENYPGKTKGKNV